MIGHIMIVNQDYYNELVSTRQTLFPELYQVIVDMIRLARFELRYLEYGPRLTNSIITRA